MRINILEKIAILILNISHRDKIHHIMNNLLFLIKVIQIKVHFKFLDNLFIPFFILVLVPVIKHYKATIYRKVITKTRFENNLKINQIDL